MLRLGADGDISSGRPLRFDPGTRVTVAVRESVAIAFLFPNFTIRLSQSPLANREL